MKIKVKHILSFLLLAAIITAAIGLFIREEQMILADLLIGGAVTTTFFITMPIFIYHRWKDRSVKDYMLSEENIKKMRDYSKQNTPSKRK